MGNFEESGAEEAFLRATPNDRSKGMAKVSRTNKAGKNSGLASKKKKPVKRPETELVLPTEPSEISDNLNDYSFLVHGEKKIGKTTLSTQEDGVLVVSADPLRPGLAIMQVHVADWKTLKQALKQLKAASKKKNFPYTRIVLDRVDLMYTYCQQHICTKFGIDHPSDEGFARAWHALRDEFAHVVLEFLALPVGCWFICHSEWKETQTRRKIKVEKLVPDLANRAEEILNGLVDGWFAYDYDGDARVLIIQGDEQVGAGHALDTHFRTPDGRAIVEVPMGDSPAEAYENFKAAFANEQTFTDSEDLETQKEEQKGGSKKTKAKKKSKKKKKA